MKIVTIPEASMSAKTAAIACVYSNASFVMKLSTGLIATTASFRRISTIVQTAFFAQTYGDAKTASDATGSRRRNITSLISPLRNRNGMRK